MPVFNEEELRTQEDAEERYQADMDAKSDIGAQQPPEQIGHCKHGMFNLFIGCPQCIAEKKAADKPLHIVKVRYFSETTGELSGRDYTYFSVDQLKIGDIVQVPVRDTTGKAKVTTVNVPDAEIQAFRDRVKTIPAGSIFVSPERVAGSLADSLQEAGAEVTVAKVTFKLFPESIPDTPTEPVTTAVATIKVKPEDDPHVITLALEANNLLDFAKLRVIKIDADLRPATEDLSIIATVKKKLKEAKDLYVKPIKGHLDDVNAAFTKIMTPLDEADKVTRDKVLAYRQAQAKHAAEAEQLNRDAQDVARRQAEMSGTGEFTANTTPVEAPAPIKRVSTDLGTASVAKVVTWELVDKNLVPEDYKILDAGKITKLVKGGGTLPGIRVIEKEGLRVTTR